MLLIPSVNFQRGFTELMDFAWGSAAALWNFRWQVAGFQDAGTNIRLNQVAERFLSGSGIPYWNLRPGFLARSWEQDQRELAHTFLVNLIALFEGWTVDVVSKFPHVAHPESIRTQLQFPSRGNYGRRFDGISEAMAKLSVRPSKLMRTSFYPTLAGQPKYSGNHLDELLAVFRYFKEIRNSRIHSGGICHPELEKSSQAIAPLTARSLGIRSLPQLPAYRTGDATHLKFEEVLFVCDLVLRVVATIDAELSLTQEGEEDLASRWSEAHPRPILQFLHDYHGWRTTLRNLLVAASLPVTSDEDALRSWLKARGFVR